MLRIADELERLDAALAAELAEVERLERETDRTRQLAAGTAAFLAGLPRALASARDGERAAEEARAAAESALAEARKALERARERGGDDERLAAERAVREAGDALREAELRLARSRDEQRRLEQEGEDRRLEAVRLEEHARALAVELGELGRVAGEASGRPAPGLDGVLEWAARARGGLLVARAGLAAERDRVVREASELVASVSGDPLAATGVAGMRDRLLRALRG